MAQIHTTISLEVEASKKSWGDLFATSGMRRRLLITCMLGLFTQWSGNTLISYYLGDLLEMIGMTNSTDVQKINVSIACWSMVCATIVALLVVKVRRRVMYLMCTISLLLCYIAWTISMQKAQTAAEAGTPNGSANIATLFFIYAYSPCYNMGYNALTYSKSLSSYSTYWRVADPPPQLTWLRFGLTRKDPVALLFSNFSVGWPAFSRPLSTQLDSTTWAGGISSRTAAGSHSRLHLSTSCFLKHSAAHLRSLRSVSRPGPTRIFTRMRELLLTYTQCSRTRNSQMRRSRPQRRQSLIMMRIKRAGFQSLRNWTPRLDLELKLGTRS